MGYHILQISNGFNSFITLNLEFHALLTRLQISANFRRANLAIFTKLEMLLFDQWIPPTGIYFTKIFGYPCKGICRRIFVIVKKKRKTIFNIALG